MKLNGLVFHAGDDEANSGYAASYANNC